MAGREWKFSIRDHAVLRFAGLKVLLSRSQLIASGTGPNEQSGINPEKENTHRPIHSRIECIHPRK
jgi:hypothetical protein